MNPLRFVSSCSVSDGDGQFLLIEAAEHIPKWLNPDTSVNRVSERSMEGVE